MQQLSWRSEQGSRAWLGALIAAMERAASPAVRIQLCSAEVREALHAQLSRPASSHLYASASIYSLRN